MAFGGDLGLKLSLRDVPREAGLEDSARLLFSESLTRFLVEVPRARAARFEKLFKGLPCARVGEVARKPELAIRAVNKKTIVKADCETLRKAWKKPLAW
jgi:phosphoribosylformylglycinamidine (FGAM) synthase-like enzyme